jgi:hypothetical protein
MSTTSNRIALDVPLDWRVLTFTTAVACAGAASSATAGLLSRGLVSFQVGDHRHLRGALRRDVSTAGGAIVDSIAIGSCSSVSTRLTPLGLPTAGLVSQARRGCKISERRHWNHRPRLLRQTWLTAERYIAMTFMKCQPATIVSALLLLTVVALRRAACPLWLSHA